MDHFDRIIVTGATSMIGTALIGEALAHGTEVYALIRPDTGRMDRLPSSPLLHLVRASLSDLSSAEGLPTDGGVFYHLAWSGTSKSARDDPDLQAENIVTTLSAVGLARRCGCQKFIGAGSQAEYGPVDGVIDASTRAAPRLAYGAAKYAAGLLSRKKCDALGITHIWGRVFSVYGPHDNADTMLDYAIRRFLAGQEAHFSAGVQMWDYLYERDAGKLFYLLGRLAGQSGAYRIASGRSRPLRGYIDILADLLDAKDLCRFAPPEGTPPAGLRADISDLTAVVGYAPDTPFEEGIAETIQSYRKRGAS